MKWERYDENLPHIKVAFRCILPYGQYTVWKDPHAQGKDWETKLWLGNRCVKSLGYFLTSLDAFEECLYDLTQLTDSLIEICNQKENQS